MAELLPTLQAKKIRESLTDYLGTTFALTEPAAMTALNDFLSHPERGIFKGPFLRMRMPFGAANAGWEDSLDITPLFPPYGHQARAFERLSSKPLSSDSGSQVRRPQPTLVTTGTGSGKTEAFLYPILDHVRRAKSLGEQGIKALILYPMNALANDQAARIADTVSKVQGLAGVTVGLYTGQGEGAAATIAQGSLITDRHDLRQTPPDILLTNYKMLDQLLLRPADQVLWAKSAYSLQYLVLDEFHTYDGAQGTDVAMLLRRLGLALKSYWPKAPDLSQISGTELSEAATENTGPDAATAQYHAALAKHGLTLGDVAQPLGKITPVATSATLGDKGDPAQMLSFARTVFGTEFTADAVVTESRIAYDNWATPSNMPVTCEGEGLVGKQIVALATEQIDQWSLYDTLNSHVDTASTDAQSVAAEHYAVGLTSRVLAHLYRVTDNTGSELDLDKRIHAFDTASATDLLALEKALPLLSDLVRETEQAASLAELATAILPRPIVRGSDTATRRNRDQILSLDPREQVLEYVVAALSHIRAVAGRDALTIELHMWVRELSRIDRAVGISPRFSWFDDGVYYGEGGEEETGQFLPAIYCRHCGRSGWHVVLAPTGSDLDTNDHNIRKEAATSNNRVRPLMYAQREADRAREGFEVSNLHWFRTDTRAIENRAPEGAYDAASESTILPVLTYTDSEANEKSVKQVCPNCDRADGIRSLGARVATLLSVTLSTMFGEQYVDAGEKKALVFTDSVQDAAHRAGFVQARSHALTLRAALNASVKDQPVPLPLLVDEVLAAAQENSHERYRIVPPDCVERPGFKEYWSAASAAKITDSDRLVVRRRLLFDALLEFGVQHTLGRTLELTGTVQTSVALPERTDLVDIGRIALEGYGQSSTLSESVSEGVFEDSRVYQWIIGVIERMRSEGAIFHEWLDTYVSNDGMRIWIWGKRPKDQGMPAFPAGRAGFAFPRVGAALPSKTESDFVQVNNAKSWYATWTARTLSMEAYQAGNLAAKLLRELAKRNVLTMRETTSGAYVYGLEPHQLLISSVADSALGASDNMLVCSVCQALTPGTPETVAALASGPCLLARCNGRLEPEQIGENFYRSLYKSSDMRRIVAREHTSMLDDDQRLEYENGFKNSSQQAGDPNVLVATPTLEMGIDIGDLSAVMLASLPRTVASYIQRVGRAGRQTGNALDLAFVRGVGNNLARIEDPLSVINGSVRAPATYLSAEEILRRQYIASVFDRIAREDTITIPNLAANVLRTNGNNPFVQQVVRFAEGNSEELLRDFLNQFHSAQVPHFEPAAQALTRWATADSDEGTSGLAREFYGAAQRWNATKDSIKHRLDAINEALPEITKRAGVPNASEDDVNALRSLRGEQRLLLAQRTNLDTQHWIGALEEHGLLPNYTLLDDSVELDVTIRWRNPITAEIETDEMTLSRGAATAIREFVPGASFYARGYRTRIQAIDLGVEASEVFERALCDSCGYSELIVESTPRSSACPRCGSTGIADTGQVLKTVELRKVSAEIMRDESMISDSTDDREQTFFGVRTIADINIGGGNLATQWFITDHEFGVRYLRSVTLTQLNLGAQRNTGAEMLISGNAERTPLFSVCEYCGKLDSASNRNTARDHRAWCIHRTALEEHNIHIGITRTLRTQGLVLRLPAAYTIGDDMAVPSLTAALFLGLREHIGGEPDHLGVIEVVDPYLSDGTQNRVALLIHDFVPGGTGYLADLADPQQLRSILLKAYNVIANCSCDPSQVMSCAHCLLPFAQIGRINHVSRVTAQKILLDLINHGTEPLEDGQPDPAESWPITQEITVQETSQSHLEARFKSAFAEMITSRGGKLTQAYSPTGPQLRFSLPNSNLTWKLTPEVPLGVTRPDFVLESNNPNLPKVAIYTDGYAFHGTTAINRIADDARKRNALRDLGYVVLAVTAQDLDLETRHFAPAWLQSNLFTLLGSTIGAQAESNAHAAVTQGPLNMLWYYIQQENAASLAGAASIAIFSWNLANSMGAMAQGFGGGQLTRIATQLESDPITETTIAQAAQSSGWESGDYFLCAIAEGNNTYLSQNHVVDSNGTKTLQAKALLVHNDTETAMSHASHKESWATWLRTANILAWGNHELTLATLSDLDELGTSEKPLVEQSPIEANWDIDGLGLTPEERELLLEIAGIVDKQYPIGDIVRGDLEIGPEIGEFVVDLTWPTYKLAVLRDASDTDIEALRSEGWTVVINDAALAAHTLNELVTTKGTQR